MSNSFEDASREKNEMISTAQHEKEMTRMETANKRMFVSFLITLIMLFLTNFGWILYESQFEDVVVTQDADSGDGGDIQLFETGIGDINYGESETNDSSTDQQK